MEEEMEARMQIDRVFIKRPEEKNSPRRESAFKAHHEHLNSAGLEALRVTRQRAEIEKEIRIRMESERAFMRSLEGRSLYERKTAIKARHEQQRAAESMDSRVIRQRAEIEREMKARIEACRMKL
jgi:hypothetical protein